MSRQDQIRPPATTDCPAEAGEDDVLLQIDIRLRLDEIVEVETRLRRERERKQPAKRDLCRLADELYEARRMRDRMLDPELFGEPAWDMLLALYCMPNRGICLGVTSLSHAANVPEATGSRCQKLLLERGLIRRGPHVHDARQQLVGLTDKGKLLLERYLIRIFNADGSRQSEAHHSNAEEPLQ